MATMTVKRFLDGVAEIIQDTAEDEDDRSTPESDLVEYYNKESRFIAAKYPDACTKTEAIQLASGIKQTIPADGIALLAVHMNMGDDGATEGTPIVKCSLAEIQASDRAWNQATATEEIINFMPDPVDPRSFYNYPPSDGVGHVLEEYSIVPEEIVWDEDGDWETAIIAINDQYLGMLEKRVLARCYKKDTDFPGNIIRENDNQEEAKER